MLKDNWWTDKCISLCVHIFRLLSHFFYLFQKSSQRQSWFQWVVTCCFHATVKLPWHSVEENWLHFTGIAKVHPETACICPAAADLYVFVAETKGLLAASTWFCAAAKAQQKRSATRGRHTKGLIAGLGGGEQRVCARVRQVYGAYRQALAPCACHMHVVYIY